MAHRSTVSNIDKPTSLAAKDTVNPTSNKSRITVSCDQALMALNSIMKFGAHDFGPDNAKINWAVARMVADLQAIPEIQATVKARQLALKHNGEDKGGGNFYLSPEASEKFSEEYGAVGDRKLAVVMTKLPAEIRSLPFPPGVTSLTVVPLLPFISEEV